MCLQGLPSAFLREHHHLVALLFLRNLLLISDCAMGSPKAFGSRDAGNLMKPKHAADGICEAHDVKSTTAKNGFVSMDGVWNERLDVTSDIQGYTNKSKARTDWNAAVTVPTITKWQGKGRRAVRVCCRNSWVSPPAAGGFLGGIKPATTVHDVFDETREDSEVIAGTSKSKKRTTRGGRHSFNIDSGAENEHLKEKSGSWSRRQQLAYQGHAARANSLHLGSTQPFANLNVPNVLWFEVPVDEDHARNAPCHEEVPQVSIMSMLKGRPIAGFTVHVEMVERRYGSNQGGSIRNHSTWNGARIPHPVWRTGRRTAMQRVPRSCSTVALRDMEPDNQLLLKHCTAQNRGMRKAGHLICSAEKRKPSKKSGLAPQKTRMLSSIAGQNGTEHDVTSNVGPPLETCIPVNVIFNRIREVLYRGLNNGASDSDNVS